MPLNQTDRSLIAQCEDAKKLSHDPDRQVGAVLAATDGRQFVTGANRPPSRLGLSPAESRLASKSDPNWKYYVLEHAERDALNTARHLGFITDGATMYVSLFPCADCARAIVAAGLRRLVVPRQGSPDARDEKWVLHHRYAREILEMARIEVAFVDPVEWEAAGTARGHEAVMQSGKVARDFATRS